MKNIIREMTAAVLAALLLLSVASCASSSRESHEQTKTPDTMPYTESDTGDTGGSGSSATPVWDGKALYDYGSAEDRTFLWGATDFSLKLWQDVSRDGGNDNTLVSPLSVMMALAMTANGADGETLAQLERVLCTDESGNACDIGTIDKYMSAYMESTDTENSKLSIANSIWIRDLPKPVAIKGDFLKANEQYFAAEVRRTLFDQSTVNEINGWVSDKTDGMIDSIIDNIPEETVMFLINALAFDAEWESPYYKEDISDGKFTASDGTSEDAEMMYSEEYGYIHGEYATGFIKDYADGRYSFAALLPEEGMRADDFAETLDTAQFIEMIDGAKSEKVVTTMPKFSFEYSGELNSALKSLGVTDAFDADDADFSLLSDDGKDLYINRVIHKTFIEVNERGTKAGAATAVEMNETSAMESEPHYVTLDRPFVFAIIDNYTSLPVFLGTVNSVAQ